MTPSRIRWILFIVPAVVIGGFETLRHTLLEQILPMELGNWVTASVDALVIAAVSHRLFQQFAKDQRDLAVAREYRVVSEERERLARALHDQLSQSMFFTGTKVQTALQAANDAGSTKLQTSLNDILVTLREADENIRQAIFNLRHDATDKVAFEDRLGKYMADRLSSGEITWKLDLSLPPPVLDPREQVQLFGILQESVLNVLKHAHASQIVIRLNNHLDTDGWEFSVRDNGTGFTHTPDNHKTYGLDILANRAHEIDCDIDIQSTAEGTVIRVTRQPMP